MFHFCETFVPPKIIRACRISAACCFAYFARMECKSQLGNSRLRKTIEAVVRLLGRTGYGGRIFPDDGSRIHGWDKRISFPASAPAARRTQLVFARVCWGAQHLAGSLHGSWCPIRVSHNSSVSSSQKESNSVSRYSTRCDGRSEQTTPQRTCARRP